MDRTSILCAHQDCARALCRDPSISVNFCCYLCESSFFGFSGSEGLHSHGPNCNRKAKPDWGAPRARAEPSYPDDPDVAVAVAAKEAAGPQSSRAWWEEELGKSAPLDSDEFPEDFIWGMVPRYIVDSAMQTKLMRFLRKTWPAALSEATGAPESSPMQRLEHFLSSWVTDSLYRFFQSYDNVPVVTPVELSELFLQLCNRGGLPRSLVEAVGMPPPDWPLVLQAVGDSFNAILPNLYGPGGVPLTADVVGLASVGELPPERRPAKRRREDYGREVGPDGAQAPEASLTGRRLASMCSKIRNPRTAAPLMPGQLAITDSCFGDSSALLALTPATGVLAGEPGGRCASGAESCVAPEEAGVALFFLGTSRDYAYCESCCSMLLGEIPDLSFTATGFVSSCRL